MRPYVALVSIALLTAFVAGVFALDVARPRLSSPADASTPAASKARFQAQAIASLRLDLGELFFRPQLASQLDPREALPQTHRFPYEQIVALIGYAERCDERDGARVTDPKLAKAKAWHAHVCSGAALPAGFFESPPLMHPSGVSFAALSGDLSAHVRFAHAVELGSVAKDKLDPAYAVVAALDAAALQALSAGEPLVVGRDVVLFGRASASGAATHRYLVYPRASFDGFFRDEPLVPRAAAPGQGCVLRDGSLCWVSNDAPRLARLSWLSLAVLCAALTCGAGAVALMLRRVKQQRQEQDRQRFALQALAHELRTPVASLLVSAESLSREYDQLPPAAQEHALRVVDGAHRLRRLAEVSAAYLRADGDGELLQLSQDAVPSVRGFVAEVLEPYGDRLTLAAADDFGARFDRHWVATCLRNLCENALSHGRAPVAVEVRCLGGRLELAVSDAGTLQPELQATLAQPFVRGPGSAGLGLGLSIVARVAGHMGGKLEARAAPTRFSLWLPLEGRR